MGAQNAKVSSNYVLKVAGGPSAPNESAQQAALPQHVKPGRRSSNAASNLPPSSQSNPPLVKSPSVSRQSSQAGLNVKQSSMAKLTTQPSRTSLVGGSNNPTSDIVSHKVAASSRTEKGGGVAICSQRLPWLIKKTKFSHNYTLASFEYGRVIGRGLMGTVRVCKTSEDKYFVMKSIKKDYIVRHHDERHVKNEKEVLTTLTSPFCIRLFGTFQDKSNVYFALEYVPGGELFRRLGRKRAFPPTEAKFYLTEIFCALEHVQRCGIVYRDLKPENITIDEEGHCKLIDFGFSIFCGGTDKMQTICGTPAYLSPEQLDGKLTHGYTRIVDWWSFGVLLYELLTGKTPFCKSNRESAYEIFLRILKNKINFPMFFDAESKELIALLCHPRIEQRLCSSEEIKAHKYFADIPWAAVLERRLIPPYMPTLKDAGDSHYFERYADMPSPMDSKEIGGAGGGEGGNDHRYEFIDF